VLQENKSVTAHIQDEKPKISSLTSYQKNYSTLKTMFQNMSWSIPLHHTCHARHTATCYQISCMLCMSHSAEGLNLNHYFVWWSF